MSRILGIDYGDVRIGLSVSDITETIANPLKFIKRNNSGIEEIVGICREQQISTVVIGYPKNMNGSEGENCRKVDDFAEKIQKNFEGRIVKWDERLSSVAIHSMLAQTGIKVGKDKGKVDMMAAVYILQGYLDYLKNEKGERQ